MCRASRPDRPLGAPDAAEGPRGDPGRLSRRGRVVLVLLFAAFTIHFVQHPSGPFRSGLAHGDGTYYYSYLRSLLFDHDLDFTNDYTLVGNQFGAGRGPGGRPENPFTIGPALFWLPFAGAAHLAARVGTSAGWIEDSLDGTSRLYQRVTFFGSLVWGFLALVLVVQLLRRYFSEGVALVAALGVALATPLPWYMTRQPCFSHAIDAFVVAAFTLYWHRSLYRRTSREWILLGLLGGLAMLVRVQNLAFFVLPLGEWLVLVARALRGGDRRLPLLGQGLLFVGAAVLAFLPQMKAWQLIYGTYLTIPQGGGFLQPAHSQWVEALSSSRHGLFAWHPLAYAGVAGLLVLALRRALPSPGRTLAVLGLLAFLLQAYINGSVLDWWGGWAFGGRRFVSCSVFFALGLAALLPLLQQGLRRVGPHLLAAAPLLLVCLFAICNVSLMDDYENGRMRFASTQEMSSPYKRSAAKVVDWIYGVTGNLGSAPASWIFAAQTGLSPARYDEIAGQTFFFDRGMESFGFDSSPLVLDGFGAPTTVQGTRCRWMVRPRGALVLPLRKPVEIAGTIKLLPAAPGTRVTLTVNGALALDATLEPGWRDYPFKLPAERLEMGLNFVSLKQIPPAAARGGFPVGFTGRSSSHELRVESEGFNVGSMARVTVGERAQSFRERGIHVVRIDAVRGTLERVGVFDFFADPSAAPAFARVVAALPDGAVVGLAVNDEGAKQWGPEADQALRSLGGTESLRGRYRWSYALLGAKGAKPGQALEHLAERTRASVSVGPLGLACAKVVLTKQTPRPAPGAPAKPAARAAARSTAMPPLQARPRP